MFWHIVQRRSTEEFESLPYICKLLNAHFWVWYGIVKPYSVLVASVNGFGAALEIIYVLIFLVFAPPRIKDKTAIIVGVLDVAFPGSAVLFNCFSTEMCKSRLQIFYPIASAWSPMVHHFQPWQEKVYRFYLSACHFHGIVFIDSTLEFKILKKTVMMTKSVEYMTFLLSFILFVDGAVWTVYAVLTRDLFIGIPNGSGFVLGTAQLFLYAMYWKPKLSKKISRDLEDRWQHERLISDENRENK